MKKYVCDPCGYVYDPEVGDPDNGIAAGTAFEDQKYKHKRQKEKTVLFRLPSFPFVRQDFRIYLIWQNSVQGLLSRKLLKLVDDLRSP